MMQYLRNNVRSIMLIVVVLFVVSCFAGYGLYNTGDQPMGGNDREVAKIDGEPIMLSRLEMDLYQMLQNAGMSATVTSADYPALRESIIDQYAVISQLDKEVEARSITVADDEINAMIKEIENTFPTREVFLQQMEMSGMTEKKLKEAVKEQILRQKVMEEVSSGVSTDETEKNNFYEMMKSYAFQKPAGFRMNLAHFRTEEIANTVKDELDAGKDWDEVMEAHSADVLDSTPYDSAVLIAEAQLTGEAAVLKDLAFDKVSTPIKLDDSDYMITLKRSKEEAATATYDEVSADIEQMILNQKRQSSVSIFMQELKNRANIVILDAELFPKEEPASDDVKPEESAADEPTAENSDEEAVPPETGDSAVNGDAGEETEEQKPE